MGPMTRGIAIFLVVLYAVLPPGFCLCRLEAALLDHEHAHDDSSEPHEDEDCGCGQLKPDGIACSGAGIVSDDSTLTPSLDEPSLTGHGLGLHVHPVHQALGSPSDTPLYLALRALLI